HNISVEDLAKKVQTSHGAHRLYPVISPDGKLEGVITRKDLHNVQQRSLSLNAAIKRQVVTAFPDEPLRVVVYRMAESGFTRMPVVDRDDPRKLLGIVSLTDLLRARTRDLEEERHRERVLRLRLPFGARRVRSATF